MVSIFKQIFDLFFPKSCVNCERNLFISESFLCVYCLHDLPIVLDTKLVNAQLMPSFYGKIIVKNVFVLLRYRKNNITQKIIHELKYRGQEEIGVFLGKRMAYELKKTSFIHFVDGLVTVPIHPNKKKKRGYNQVTKFAEILSDELSIPYYSRVLIRLHDGKNQALKKQVERVEVHKKFELTDVTLLQGKHLLLIDDVITTGTTLVDCGNELLKAPNSIISIAAIAFTEKE